MKRVWVNFFKSNNISQDECFSLVSVAIINNTMTIKPFGEKRVCLAYKLQPIILDCQRAEGKTWRHEHKQRPWRIIAYWLLSIHTSTSKHFYLTQGDLPRGGMACSGLASAASIKLMKKMYHRYVQSPLFWRTVPKLWLPVKTLGFVQLTAETN